MTGFSYQSKPEIGAVNTKAGSPPKSSLHAFGAWRCKKCQRLLGLHLGGLLEINWARRHQYVVNKPARTLCPRCGEMNTLD